MKELNYEELEFYPREELIDLAIKLNEELVKLQKTNGDKENRND